MVQEAIVKRCKTVLMYPVRPRWSRQLRLHRKTRVGSKEEMVSWAEVWKNATLQLGHQKCNLQFSFSLATKPPVISVNDKPCMIEKNSGLWNTYANCSSQRYILCPNCSISNIFYNCNVELVYSIVKSVKSKKGIICQFYTSLKLAVSLFDKYGISYTLCLNKGISYL